MRYAIRFSILIVLALSLVVNFRKKPIYKRYTANEKSEVSRSLTLYSDSTFVYVQYLPEKLKDPGTWSVADDTITITSENLTREIGGRLFDKVSFGRDEGEIRFFHQKYKSFFILKLDLPLE